MGDGEENEREVNMQRKTKLGPPFKPREDVRDKRLVVRITAAEEKEILAIAAENKWKVATLVRLALHGFGLNISRK